MRSAWVATMHGQMTSSWERVAARLAQRAPKRDAPDGVPQAAVAALLLAGASDLELLLIRRAEHSGDPWSGHMALPGGRRDPDDADLRATALREVREEVGIDLDEAEFLGELDDLRPVTAPARVVVRPFVFGLHARPTLALSPEVAYEVWAGLQGLATSAGTTHVVHRGALREMPCYRVGEHVVWGMTHRILEPFVELALRGL
jgi:8-oxo-dGTP pyrophosphatase MutT (NUDIX family)